MEFSEILSIALASLVVLVVAHLAAYWVVKTLYPPSVPVSPRSPVPEVVPVPRPSPTVSFTDPPVTEQQNVTIPTYEAPVPAKAPREEGERRGPPPAESTSIRGDAGAAAPHA